MVKISFCEDRHFRRRRRRRRRGSRVGHDCVKHE